MNFSQDEDLFICYFTQNHIPQWQQLPWDVKFQIEFVFKLYAAQYISSNQLILIAQKFERDITHPTSLLICAWERPEELVEREKQGHYWSKYERLLLVTCYVKYNKNFDKLCSFLPGRSHDSCRFEMSRIIKLYLNQKEYHEDKNAQDEAEEPIIYISNEVLNQINKNVEEDQYQIEYSKKSPNNQVSRQKLAAEKKKLHEEKKKQQIDFARKNKILIHLQRSIENEENHSQLQDLQNEFSVILNDSMSNLGLGNGKRYSDASKTFWMRLRMYSRKAFSMIKNYLEGPSDSTVDLWINKNNDFPRCSDLENIDQVYTTFLFWKNKLNISDETNFSISIDAAKVDENLSIKYNGDVGGTIDRYELQNDPIHYLNDPELYRRLWEELLNQKKLITHIFVILMCPIATQRGFPIYIKFTNSGSATENVTNDLDQIIFLLISNGTKIRFIGSDSEQCYRRRFNIQFEQVMETMINGRINLGQLSNEMILYSNDAYHCLKRLRKAMVNSGSLFIKPHDIGTNNCVSKYTLQHIDKTLPDCIFRQGSLQSMDDYYPHALFNKKTLAKARKTSNSAVIFYLWIGVLVRKVMSSKKLTRAQRCEMCYIGLYIAIYYKLFFFLFKQEKVSKKILSTMIMSFDMCTDLSNFFISMIKALTTVNDSFPLSRIGSILSEHFFGRIRNNAGNSQTADSIRASINRIQFIDAYRIDDNFDDANHRRKLQSAVVEQGALSFDEIEIDRCRDFVCALFISAGLYLKFDDFGYDWIMSPVYTDGKEPLSIKYFDMDVDEGEEQKKRWTLNAANFRVNGRYGRNIKGRYITMAKLQ